MVYRFHFENGAIFDQHQVDGEIRWTSNGIQNVGNVTLIERIDYDGKVWNTYTPS